MEILDFYHVSERLSIIAHSKHERDPVEVQACRERQKQALLRWGFLQLLNELSPWRPTGAAAEVQWQQLGYFVNQAERIHYPTYLPLGSLIGSGAVGRARKQLVADWFRGTGLR